MTLAVENDTGLANADAYVDEATFRAYWLARNVGVTDYDTAQVEAAIRAATQYVDSKYRYNAQVLVSTQALEFPRADLNDGNGRILNTVPRRVKDATCEAALISVQGVDLYEVLDRGGQITAESVGGISVSYAPGADPGKLIEAVERLLSPYVRDPKRPQRMIPVFGTSDAPIFSQSQFDYPGTDNGEV